MYKFLGILALVTLVGAGCSTIRSRVLSHAHSVAEEYCKAPESVRMEMRADFTAKGMTEPWVKVNCEAL